eukprot:14897461-Ditylum_brightwellii.AAC.1
MQRSWRMRMLSAILEAPLPLWNVVGDTNRTIRKNALPGGNRDYFMILLHKRRKSVPEAVPKDRLKNNITIRQYFSAGDETPLENETVSDMDQPEDKPRVKDVNSNTNSARNIGTTYDLTT